MSCRAHKPRLEVIMFKTLKALLKNVREKERNYATYPEVVFLCLLTSLLPILRFPWFFSESESDTVDRNTVSASWQLSTHMHSARLYLSRITWDISSNMTTGAPASWAFMFLNLNQSWCDSTVWLTMSTHSSPTKPYGPLLCRTHESARAWWYALFFRALFP